LRIKTVFRITLEDEFQLLKDFWKKQILTTIELALIFLKKRFDNQIDDLN